MGSPLCTANSPTEEDMIFYVLHQCYNITNMVLNLLLVNIEVNDYDMLGIITFIVSMHSPYGLNYHT
jgi:hypothetical protein